MKRELKLNLGQKAQEDLSLSHSSQTRSGTEFANSDQLLRHDALHTPVPPAIARRLQEEIRDIPRPSRPWWKKIFGRT